MMEATGQPSSPTVTSLNLGTRAGIFGTSDGAIL